MALRGVPGFPQADLGTPTPGSGPAFARKDTVRSSRCAQPCSALQKTAAHGSMHQHQQPSTATTTKKGWETRSREIIRLFPQHQAPTATTALFSLLPSRGKVSRRAEMLISPDTHLPHECQLTWILCPAVLGPEPGSILRKRHTIQQNRGLSNPS